LDEVCEGLRISDEKRRRRVEKYLNFSVREKYLLQRGERYEANPRYLDAWSRLKKLVKTLGDRFFFGEADKPNVMRIVKDVGSIGLQRWTLLFSRFSASRC